MMSEAAKARLRDEAYQKYLADVRDGKVVPKTYCNDCQMPVMFWGVLSMEYTECWSVCGCGHQHEERSWDAPVKQGTARVVSPVAIPEATVGSG
jgi:hypothetical protein